MCLVCVSLSMSGPPLANVCVQLGCTRCVCFWSLLGLGVQEATSSCVGRHRKAGQGRQAGDGHVLSLQGEMETVRPVQCVACSRESVCIAQYSL